MSSTKILCPIDFSPGSQQALRVAARLAKESNAELVIVHSWYQPMPAYSLASPYPPYVVDRLVEQSQRKLDAAVREATEAGVRQVRGDLLSGIPWVEIVGQLEAHPFALCVIGTHGRSGISRILLGSVAEKVVRHAPSPVLAVRSDGGVERFAHALVPTDFSDNATYALDLAAKLVHPPGRITLLHVIELATATSSPELPLAELEADFDRLATDELAKQVARLKSEASVPIAVSTRVGYPGAQTLAMLDDDRSIDLVVMGSEGRTGIKRALLGSVAEKVVRYARCPVLVARKRP